MSSSRNYGSTRICVPRSWKPRIAAVRLSFLQGNPIVLLTITTTRAPATDLGWLLHKHPAKVQDFSLSFGRAQVFYPDAAEQRCTAALLLDVDPVGLVRGQRNR